MQPSTRRMALTLGLILVLASGLVAGLSMLLQGTGGSTRSRTSHPGPSSRPPAQHQGLETLASPQESRDAVGHRPQVSRPAPCRMLFLRSTDQRPVPGIRIWAGEELLAGPTAKDGVLDVPMIDATMLTAWGEGWLPQELRSEALPERVLLVAADASLEVRLLNVEPRHRVARTLVQPHVRLAAGGGPWDVRLERLASDRYGAARIPAGTYDLYFWVSLDGGEPRTRTILGVEVAAGERAIHSLDLSAPPVPEPDH